MPSSRALLPLLAAVAAVTSCGAPSPPPAVPEPPVAAPEPPPPPAPEPAPTVVRNPPLPPLPARLVVQRGPAGGFEAAVTVSHDGLAATWSSDHVLRFWDLRNRALVRAIPENLLLDAALVHPVRPVWDDDTKEVLLAHRDGLLGVDVNGKQKLRPWPSGNMMDHVQELSPLAAGNARWLALNLGRFRLLDAAGKTVGNLRIEERLGSDIAVSADGKWAIGAFDKGIVRFALDKLPVATKLVKLKETPVASQSVTANQGIALTPHGDFAYVCVKGKKGEEVVSVSNLGGAPNIRPVKLPEGVGCRVAATPDGDLVVAALGDALFGIDAHTAAVRWRAPFSELALALAAEPRGHAVAAVRTNGAITVLDARSGNVLGDLGEPINVPQALAFQKDGPLIAVGRRPSMFSSVTHVAAWSLRDGGLEATADVDWGSWFRLAEDGTLRVARAVFSSSACAKGEHPIAFSAGTLAGGAPAGEGAKGAWPPAPSKDAVVCVPADANTHAADPESGRVLIEQRGKPPSYSVLDAQGASHPLTDVPPGGIGGTQLWFSRDGRWVLGAPGVRGGWSNLHVWSATTGEKVGTFTADPTDTPGVTLGVPRRGYWAEDVSDDGTVLAVGSGDRVTLYELPGKRVVRTVTLPAGSYVTAVAMAAGSTSAVFAGFANGDLVLSPGEGALVSGDSSGGAIYAIRARKDGVRVATASDDGAVRVWDARTVEPLAALVEFADGEYLATTPRGAYAGTAEAADRVRWVFDAPTEAFAFHQFARTFQRPDLLARRLSSGAQDIEDSIARPPRVEQRGAPSRVAAGVLPVTAHVSSPSAVASLRAFVEGRLVASKDVGAKAADVTLDVPLLPGANTVTLLAFDDKGASSNPESFEVTATQKGASRPDVWVVAAGVGRYPNLEPGAQLEASVNDARAIAAAFAAQAAPGKRFARAHTTVLADDEVTPQALVVAIEGLSAMKPDDLAVVFLAGHGVKAKTSEMVFLTGGATRDVASLDRSGIGWNKIGAALARARGRVLVLVDACHSGHMSQELIVPNSALADDLVTNQRAGVVVFAASKGRQLSFEAHTSRGLVLSDDQEKQVGAKPEPAAGASKAKPSAAVGHGFFTGAILRTLETPASDVDGDGSIELSELVSQVTLRVSKVSRGAQTPWVARRELFGDFALARAAR